MLYTPAGERDTLPIVKKGYGDLIAAARVREDLTPEALARKLRKRTKTIVYKLESETQEPTAEQVNLLAAALPISVESILEAMGVQLTPAPAHRLPPKLLTLLGHLETAELDALLVFVERLMARGNQSGGSGP